MKLRKKSVFLAVAAILILSLFSISCAQVSAEDVQGLLQAMEGKEMIIKLDDGSTIRVTVEDIKAAAQAQELVGKQVDVKVTDSKGVRKLDSLERRGKGSQDEHFSGVVESISNETFVIGGKTFKVNATTVLDSGLVTGATARVEFITLEDGSLLAMNIETNEADSSSGELRFSGKLEVLADGYVTVDGKRFVRNAATRVDDDVVVGDQVRVKFIEQADSSMLAARVQKNGGSDSTVLSGSNQFDVTGIIDSVTATTIVVDGQTFYLDANTRLDQGLVAGARARVDFDIQADDTKLASRVQIDSSTGPSSADSRLRGQIETITKDTLVVGGKTFKLTAFSDLDQNLAVGDTVKVEFVVLADSTYAAVKVRGEDSSSQSGTPTSTSQSENHKFSGTIESITADSFIIGGKTFKVNAATILDNGLAVGKMATVEFINMADGVMLALEIETDDSSSDDEAGDDSGKNRGGNSGKDD